MIKFCTEQEFRVIQICKFIKNYMHQFTNVNTKKNYSNRSRCNHTLTTRSTKHHFLSSPNLSYTRKQNFADNSIIKVRPAPKSLNFQGCNSSWLSYTSSNFSNSRSSKKSSLGSHVLNASYLAVLERHRTSKHAKLLVKQAEERMQRKLKLLEKTFDHKKN